MHLVLVGLSHHTAPLEMRERIGISRSMVPAALDRLANDGCDDAVLLSTCNRTEVYAVAADPAAMGERVIACLADYRGVQRDDIDASLYVRTDADAARHLFRVAAGLDSLVVGEPEILGQVKDAYKVASEGHGTGAVLNRLFHGAFAIGKRVRTDTGLAEGAVSLSYAALTLARKIFGDLRSHHMVVLGAGEMARLCALHFHEHVASTTIATRRQDRGELLAAEVDGQVRSAAPTSWSLPRAHPTSWCTPPTSSARSAAADARCSSSISRCRATSTPTWPASTRCSSTTSTTCAASCRRTWPAARTPWRRPRSWSTTR
jgi:glutamyl-tRNA reductase